MPPVVRAQRQVQRTAIAGTRKSAGETALSQGAEESSVAQAIGTLGGQAAQFGASAFGRLQQEARDQANATARLTWQNRFYEFEKTDILAPETGALAQLGEAAMGLPEQIDQRFTALVGEIEKGLSNDAQRAQFAEDKLRYADSVTSQVSRHVQAQIQRVTSDTLTANLSNRVQTAGANANDPRRVALDLVGGEQAIRDNGPKLGMSQPAIEAALTAFRTEMYQGVITNLLSQGQDMKARGYLAVVGVEMQADARARLTEMVKSGSTQILGLRTAETLWQEFGPTGETDPIKIADMETAAREQFKDDPDALTATIRYLRERKAGVDAQRQDVQEQTSGAVWVAASQGATLAQVARMPEFLALPGRVQATVSDYIVSHAAQREARAASAEGRAYTAESRAYTRQQRAEAEQTTKGWARYWELSNPAELTRTSENALQSMRGELGDDHVNRLLTQKRGLDRGEAEVRAATIDADLFNTTAQAAGLDAYTPKNDAERAALGQLRNAVETAIDVEQQRTGKALTRDQKQAIMRSLTDQRVMLNVSWGSDTERIASMVTNPDDRAAAYVPIAKVPAAALAQYLNYARSLSPAMQRMSDAELRSTFTDRIQRAYALRVLGAGQSEIEAAMKGEE